MECRYSLDNDPVRSFANAEHALIALSQDGIMQGVMVDKRYPGISIHFDIETGVVSAFPLITSDNHITYLYADTILDIIVNRIQESIASISRLFLLEELARLTKNERIMTIVKEGHYDATGQRINFELNHCRKTQRRILNEFKPRFSFLTHPHHPQRYLYNALTRVDLNEIKCTQDAVEKVKMLEMHSGPRFTL